MSDDTILEEHIQQVGYSDDEVAEHIYTTHQWDEPNSRGEAIVTHRWLHDKEAGKV